MPTRMTFYTLQTCHNLHVDVMRSIALGLDLEEKFFDSKINEQCHNLRLLSYPPIKTASLQGKGQVRAGAHSGKTRTTTSCSDGIDALTIVDYGTLTLLFQDSVS